MYSFVFCRANMHILWQMVEWLLDEEGEDRQHMFVADKSVHEGRLAGPSVSASIMFRTTQHRLSQLQLAEFTCKASETISRAQLPKSMPNSRHICL